jgi:hypothetical protein
VVKRETYLVRDIRTFGFHMMSLAGDQVFSPKNTLWVRKHLEDISHMIAKS